MQASCIHAHMHTCTATVQALRLSCNSQRMSAINCNSMSLLLLLLFAWPANCVGRQRAAPSATPTHDGSSDTAATIAGGVLGTAVLLTLLSIIAVLVVVILVMGRRLKRAIIKRRSTRRSHNRQMQMEAVNRVAVESSIEPETDTSAQKDRNGLSSLTNLTSNSFDKRKESRLDPQELSLPLGTMDPQELSLPLGTSNSSKKTLTLPELTLNEPPNDTAEHYYKVLCPPEDASECAMVEEPLSGGSAYWAPASREHELKFQLQECLHLKHVSRETIEIGECLGSGQFGSVNRGVWRTPSRELDVAVKSLPVGSSENERVKFLQEAAIMGQFKHPNIVRLYAIIDNSEPMMLVCELMHKGDLLLYLRSKMGGYKIRTSSKARSLLLSFCRQVAAGMSYLANKGFIHRDLAARNILVSQHNTCKIGDFGLSKELRNKDSFCDQFGKVPVRWTAPEAISKSEYCTASDVWSYGILLYEIWSLGEKPYSDLMNIEVVEKVLDGYRLSSPSGCPKSIYQLMMWCWHPEQKSRPSFCEVLLVLQRPDYDLLEIPHGATTPSPLTPHIDMSRKLTDVILAGMQMHEQLAYSPSTGSQSNPLRH